jgi:hypothetical protein
VIGGRLIFTDNARPIREEWLQVQAELRLAGASDFSLSPVAVPARTTFGLPLWPIVAIGSVVVVKGIWDRPKRRRRRRILLGLCIHCSYDLTGNVSGKCPECGTATDSKVGVLK